LQKKNINVYNMNYMRFTQISTNYYKMKMIITLRSENV
jgi:hypothetical protein